MSGTIAILACLIATSELLKMRIEVQNPVLMRHVHGGRLPVRTAR